MKKLLLSLAAMAAFGISNAEEITLDFTTDNYGEHVYASGDDKDYMADGASFSDGAVTITVHKNGGNGCRFWSTGSAQQFRVMNKGGFTVSVDGGTISGITMTGSNITYFQVDGTNIADGAWSGSASAVEFTNAGANGKTGTVQVKTMVVTYTGGAVDNRKDAGLSFPESSYTVRMGDEFTAPVLTKATNAAVTYTSTSDEIAAVNPTTGDVEILAPGTVTITASAEANDEFKAGRASYTLQIMGANEILSADFSTNCGFTFEDGTLPEGLTYIWTRDSSYGYMKASAYVSGTNYAVDGAYLVSPELDLTDWTDVKMTFRTVVNFFASVEASKEECTVHVREIGGEWGNALTIPAWPEALGWSPWTDSGDIDLSAFSGKKVQVGFKYTSTEKAGTWEVDNVMITGNRKASGVEAAVVADQEAPVEYYNLQGVRVANPEGGIFIRRQGTSVSKVVIR